MDLEILEYSSKKDVDTRIEKLEEEIKQKQHEVDALRQPLHWLGRTARRHPEVRKFGSVTFCVYAVFCSTMNKAYSPKQLQEELHRHYRNFHIRSIQKAIAKLIKAKLAERVCAGMYAYRKPVPAKFGKRGFVVEEGEDGE